MARHHKGNFSAKHPPEIVVSPEVAAAVTSNMSHGKISCQTAFALAAEGSVRPSIVGTAIDLQEGRIIKCQLGLFGYGRSQPPPARADGVDDGLGAEIRAALENGRLSCKRAWQIADGRNIPRMELARACEFLGIRISQCQLGAF